MNETRPILTITGSDSTSGSGVQADIKTISELGGYAVTAITSITVQTTLGIQEFYDLPAEIVSGQIDAVMNDVQPEVVKIGMVRTREVLDVIVRALEKYHPRHVIFDAVMSSSQGDVLVSEDVIQAVRQRLLPLCTLVLGGQPSTFNLQPSTLSHGLSNRYASAVAVYLSKCETAEQAQLLAREYINTRILRVGDLKGRASELYNEFLDAVDGHFRQNSDVHFYANRLNVTPRYLAQVTKRISGKAPKTIIDDYLIREIELQLNTTERTVQEIAYSCGFSSQAHLTKFFKKLKGVSPTAFRKTKQ